MKKHFIAALLVTLQAAHAEELPRCHSFASENEPEMRQDEQLISNFCFAVDNKSTLYRRMVRVTKKHTGSRRSAVDLINKMSELLDCPSHIRTCT